MRVKLELSMLDLAQGSQNPQQGEMLEAARKAKELERGRDLSCMIRILCKPREFVLGINGSRSVEAKKIRYCFNILLRHKMLSPFAL